MEGESLYNLDADIGETNDLTLCPSISEEHKVVLNILRQKALIMRDETVTPQTISTSLDRIILLLPVFPSPKGCWLPPDSPLYWTYRCLTKTPNVTKPILDVLAQNNIPPLWINATEELIADTAYLL
jgi:hypothetical protein